MQISCRTTLRCPAVLGLAHSMVLRNRETGRSADGDSVSKQGQIYRGVVLHLLRQGYTAPGQIAVLTPYLGQLQLLKSELARVRHDMVVELDERDQEELDEAEAGEAPPAPRGVHRASAAEHVRLATVDNFQGEEADIVLISTARNQFGFVAESNRCNARAARHGRAGQL